ncbi:hypothetical protein EVAR_75435_1 [Eumeta japonica]|uniref:Uncharacterized protein n=1 Tax=Eumeta variegata TaxID=151549 RepID=A0A4C1TN01_EUMVA|nr:hypothetical protein EVAR_75435_1 [Eumeta japonica]
MDKNVVLISSARRRLEEYLSVAGGNEISLTKVELFGTFIGSAGGDFIVQTLITLLRSEQRFFQLVEALVPSVAFVDRGVGALSAAVRRGELYSGVRQPGMLPPTDGLKVKKREEQARIVNVKILKLETLQERNKKIGEENALQ